MRQENVSVLIHRGWIVAARDQLRRGIALPDTKDFSCRVVQKKPPPLVAALHPPIEKKGSASVRTPARRAIQLHGPPSYTVNCYRCTAGRAFTASESESLVRCSVENCDRFTIDCGRCRTRPIDAIGRGGGNSALCAYCNRGV
jgi:hypothetical protein